MALHDLSAWAFPFLSSAHQAAGAVPQQPPPAARACPLRAATQGWATASDGQAALSTPWDLAVLGQHLALCSAASGRWVALRCGAGRLLGFFSARRVTTGATLVVLGALLLMWF